MARTRIGELLVAQGRIDSLQLASALAHQRQWGGRIGNAIVRLGFLPEAAILEAVGQQLGVPFVEIGERHIPAQVLSLVPERLMRSRRVLPLARLSDGKRGPLVVALPDPGDLAAIDEIAFATGMQVKPVLAAEPDIERALSRVLDGQVAARPAGFGERRDAVDLPADTNPLTLLRDKTSLH
jgi:type IV pilus assembly protein PilB